MGRVDRARGFTLLEIIAVLAIMGVLASVAAPAIIRSIDDGFAAAEEQTLAALGEALATYVRENKRIPSRNPDSWSAALTEFVDLSQTRLRENDRSFQRAIYFDPQFMTTTDTPFSGVVQVTGFTQRPNSPRAMIVSDLRGDAPSAPTTHTAVSYTHLTLPTSFLV